MTRPILCLLISLITLPAAGRPPAQARDRTLSVAAGSPLAATSATLYGLSRDGTLLRRPASLDRPWEPVTLESPLAASGIAIDGDALLVTDRERRAVLRVIPDTGRITVLHEGMPLQAPSDVARVGRSVYVADGSRLFRIATDGRPSEVRLSGASRTEQIFLASAGNSLVISSGSHVFEYTGEARTSDKSGFSVMQGKVPESSNARASDEDTIQRRKFPEVPRPGRVAFHGGVAYVIDQDARKIDSLRPSQHTGLYAFGRHDRRVVRLVRNPVVAGQPQPPVSSVTVTAEALFVLRGAQIERWPRLVPAEISLPQSNWSEIMTAVYEYLADRRILPLRQVPLRKTVEHTLREEGVLLAAYRAELTPVLCRANPSLCTRAGALRSMQEGDPLWVPDANSELYIDTIEAELPAGMKNLGTWVDALVESDRFESFRTEEKLREFNEKAAYDRGGPLRERRSGRFVVPAEFRRYVTAIDARDAPPARGSPLSRLETMYRGVTIRSQEERLAAAAASGPGVAQEPDWKPLQAEFVRLLKTIDYAALAQWLVVPKVGIAENTIDEDHPDFIHQGLRAWVPEDDSLAAEEAGVPPPAPMVRRVREFEKTDHGTMVGGLIGARHMAFGSSGLAPKAMLYHIHSSDPQIGEDVRKAFNRGVRIFNISAHYGIGKVPASLETRLNAHPSALFVVAAGNDSIPVTRPGAVCRDFMAFPVCWADRPNVIVVTATDAAGEHLLAPITNVDPVVAGANWNPAAVHVAAPGEGFHAPGVGRSYVPARGSSFAAPLVTAVAAMLLGQRIHDPLAIKRRILSTADSVPGLTGKTFAGRINVKRAVENISVGVLTRRARENVSAAAVTLDIDGGTVIRVRAVDADDDTPIRLARLLRIHRSGNASFRVVYLDAGGAMQILENVTFRTAQNATFRATRVDNGQSMNVNLTEWDDFVGPIPIA